MSKRQTGHIRQRENGLWEGQYVYERERRSIYGKTREEVSRRLGEILRSIEEGNYTRPNQHTLLSWLREWLNTYAKPTLRPSTFTNYEMTIERHFNNKLGRVKLKNVSTRMLQDFFNEKLISGRADKKSGGLSAKTLKNMKYMLHVALDQAYYDKLISSNPVDGVRLPVPDGPEQRVLRPEEKERICAHAVAIHTFPAQGVILLLTCGLRRGELLGLQWQDVDLEKGVIKIRHTLSRLQKFDINQSAYQYIRLDTYAPKTNRTAIYLGPVKTKKASLLPFVLINAYPENFRQNAEMGSYLLWITASACRKSSTDLDDGKEDSMKETHQGCLSCAINKFSELPTGSENLPRLSKTLFRQPGAVIFYG